MIESTFEVDDISLYRKICGSNDRNIKKIEELSGASIIPRGNTLIVKTGKEKNDAVIKILHIMSDVLHMKDDGYEFDDFDIKYLTNAVLSGKNLKADDINRLKIKIPDTGRVIVPRTVNQANYITAINAKPITFATGPAGTGKTFLAVVMAMNYLLNGRVERIVLTRPAVEAGENLGYLPGDLIQKINPYLRPLYDALFELQSFEKIGRLIEKNSIEIAPLAYMRGRTLNNSFIILDEAQNTSLSQMKMFLTRMGVSSKIVISGDETQIDLEKPKNSGLLHVMKILRGINDICFIKFGKEDISRHPIVERIVAAYENSGFNE
jgi:phosphate starvation-inducible protein PhoH and related proteins